MKPRAEWLRRALAAATSAVDRYVAGEQQERPTLDDGAAPRQSRFVERVLVAIGASRSWPLIWQFGTAIALVLTALTLRLTLLGALDERLAYVAFYPAVATAAIVGGLSAGALAAVLSAVLAHSMITPLREAVDWLALATFLISCALIVTMAEALHNLQAWLAAAERHRESEQRLRLFIEQAPVAMAKLDRQMRYLAVSQRWMSDYGLEEPLLGRSHYDVFPEIPERWRRMHRCGLAGEVVRADEDVFTRLDGSMQWLKWEVRPWYRAPGEIGGIIISSEDVTARRRAQEALAASEARYRAIVDTAVDAIVVIDEDGIIQSLNPATSSLFGYTPDELRGRHVKVLMPETHARAYSGYIEAYKRTGIPWVVAKGHEVEGRRKDGSTFPAELTVAAWHDAKGQRFFTGTTRDITARRQAEQVLADAMRLEAIGQLAGGVGHDFNNSLAVIVGSLELSEGRIVDPTASDLVRRALRAANLASTVTRRLLSLARKPEGEAQTISLNDTVRETMPLLESLLAGQYQLRMTLADNLWLVRVHPGEVSSALLNLGTNARDATPEGGRIEITTSNVKIEQANGGSGPGDYVSLSVTDTGAGMSGEVLKNVWEPFYSTKKPGRGTGLGLTAVKNLMELERGFANIVSAPGQGTTVSLHFPRVGAEAPAHIQTDPAPLPLGDGEMILVVDDDDEVRETTMKRLEALGYAVRAARSGEEAAAELGNDDATDLVFSDVNMPGMSGYQLARWIRAHRPRTRVVLTSGFPGDMNGSECGDGLVLLYKPYTREQLARCIRQALAGASLTGWPSAAEDIADAPNALD